MGSWVTSDDAAAIRAAAARSNAEWCAAVCRAHGIPNTYRAAAWCSARRTPLYYPDAVTLRQDAAPHDFLPEIDTASPGCSVKDSFAAVDLTSAGFVELLTAEWIHRPAGMPVAAHPALRVEEVRTAAQLRDWQIGWHGCDDAPDVLRPAVLDDASVLVLSFADAESNCGGVVLNLGSGLVGVSNLFAIKGRDVAAVWISAISAAAHYFPGVPLVGYERADELGPAVASGFAALGPLRVWVHAANPPV